LFFSSGWAGTNSPGVSSAFIPKRSKNRRRNPPHHRSRLLAHVAQTAVPRWGLGTFPVVYPEFRSFYTTFFVNQAHNDYLQLLVETGLAGFAIAVWFLVLVFRRAASKLKNWTENASGALTVAALLGCVGILVHSFLDFNLQIPANAALFYVLCAIAAAGPLQESQRRRVLRRHSLSVEPNPESSAS